MFCMDKRKLYLSNTLHENKTRNHLMQYNLVKDTLSKTLSAIYFLHFGESFIQRISQIWHMVNLMALRPTNVIRKPSSIKGPKMFWWLRISVAFSFDLCGCNWMTQLPATNIELLQTLWLWWSEICPLSLPCLPKFY